MFLLVNVRAEAPTRERAFGRERTCEEKQVPQFVRCDGRCCDARKRTRFGGDQNGMPHCPDSIRNDGSIFGRS
jgi:hypothetical protein